MANQTIRWAPSADATIATYEIEKAAAFSGPWSVLTSVAHNLGGANYSGGLFFFTDSVSPAGTFYRVSAIDGAGQRSAPSNVFKANGLPGGLATLDDLKTFLQISGTHPEEALLLRLLLSASGWFESQTGRKFSSASYTETFIGTGGTSYVPRQFPVVNVSEVLVDGITIPVAVAASDSGHRQIENSVYLRGYEFTEGTLCSVTYSAGYEVIPADVVQAVIEIAAGRWRYRSQVGKSGESNREGNVTFAPYQTPVHIQAVIDAYRRVSV